MILYLKKRGSPNPLNKPFNFNEKVFVLLIPLTLEGAPTRLYFREDTPL